MRSEYIAIIVIVACFIIGIIIYKVIESHNRKVVKENSDLYSELLSLNKRYKFENIPSIPPFVITCKSKRSLDNYDFDKNFRLEIEQRITFYRDLLIKLKSNSDKWKEYSQQYHKCKPTTKEAFKAKKLKIPYGLFLFHEKKLFMIEKLSIPTQGFLIKYIATYTSPAGRNSYRIDKCYTNNDIAKIINQMDAMRAEQKHKEEEEKLKKEEALKKQEELRKQREEIKKQKAIEAKQLKDVDVIRQQQAIIKQKAVITKQKDVIIRQKEEIKQQKAVISAKPPRDEEIERGKKEIRIAKAQISKKESDLTKREELLLQREEDFKAATRGHIYSTNHSPSVEAPENNDENSSLWVKLKNLKRSYDNGEITYSEYEQLRKKLL